MYLIFTTILLSRGAIVNRACGRHKDLRISLFFLNVFGPISYDAPPVIYWGVILVGGLFSAKVRAAARVAGEELRQRVCAYSSSSRPFVLPS